MTPIACWWAGVVDGTAHRARCPRCAAEARFDARIQALAPATPATSDARALAAIDRAFAHAPGRPSHALALRGRLAIAAGVIALAAIAIVWLASGSSGSSAPAELAVGARARGPAVVAVAHAELALAAGATMVRVGPHEVRVDGGEVEVEVDPEPHAPFRVTTAAFAVDVLGTHFTVTPGGVAVARGVVRVIGADGFVLAPHVGAGEQWRLPPPVTASADLPSPSPSPSPSPTKSPTPTPTPKIAHPAPKPVVDATATIASARALVASGDAVAARTVLVALLRGTIARSARADAEELVAESYLASDAGEAQRRLADVAERYRELPIAEAALFAASKAAARRGAHADERALLERYVARYPGGSLAAPARRRLAVLGPDAR